MAKFSMTDEQALDRYCSDLEAREADYQRLLTAVRELLVAIDIQGNDGTRPLAPTERLKDAVRELRGYVR